jgi:chromosome segregation ATPase
MQIMASVAVFGVACAVTTQEGSSANPIRTVVNMLQNMQKKIEQEGEEQDEMFAKFECYCTKNTEKLQKSIEESKVHIDDLTTANAEDIETDKQLESELKQHKEERASATETIETAEAMRKKDNAAFEAEAADLKQNVKAMNAAVAAIEKGTGQAFLQTPGAAVLRHLVAGLDDENRQVLGAFLEQRDAASGAGSDEIVGILKTMVEEMSARLSEIEATEQEAASSHSAMVTAKNQEIEAAQSAIEEKTERHGELAVKIATDKNDLKATTRALAEDEEYLVQLQTNCETETKDFEEVKKSRAEELVAVAETIKILNSDDALELFKKALPSPSLLQVSVSSQELRSRAAQFLSQTHGVNVDLLLLSLRGKKEGFEEVLKMIDGMVSELHNEMKDDEDKKAYCGEEIYKIEDKLKETAREIEGLEAHIEADKETIAKTTGQIQDLKTQIKDLDKAVAEATELRKQEHEAYVAETAQNQAALELLEFAKNRMNKFYAPEQYQEPPPEELSEEERIEQAYSFVQVVAHHQEAPPPPPAVATHKKQEGATGVLSLLTNIMSDLKLEMSQGKLQEEDAQKDYEKLSSDSAASRTALGDSLEENESALADAQGELLDLQGDLTGTVKRQEEEHETEMRLHAECDWLVENFATRKKAREEEIEALEQGKAILSGAGSSFLQTGHFLAQRL